MDSIRLPPFPVEVNGFGHQSPQPGMSPQPSPVSINQDENSQTASHPIIKSSRVLKRPEVSPVASAELVFAPMPSETEIIEIASPATVHQQMTENQKRKKSLLESFNATIEAESEHDSGSDGPPDAVRRSTSGSVYSDIRSAGSWFYRFLGSRRNSLADPGQHTHSLRSNKSSTMRSKHSATSTPLAETRTGSDNPEPVRTSSAHKTPLNRERSKKAQTLWAKATWYAMQEVNAKRERRTREENSRTFNYDKQNGKGKGGKKQKKRASVVLQDRRSSSAGVGFEEVVLEAMRRDMEEKRNRHRNSFVGLVQRVIDANWFHTFMMIATAYSLYGLDLYILTAPNASRDRDMYITSVTCFAVFGLEWLVRSIFSHRFLFSFFWWLDLIATASFIPDVVWVARGVDVFASAVGVLVLARAGRVGARMSRIVRVVALFSRTRFRGEKIDPALADPQSPHYDPNHSQAMRKESQLGRRLDHKVSLHTMMVVGLMLVLIILNGVFGIDNVSHTGIHTLAVAYHQLQAPAPATETAPAFRPFVATFLADMASQDHDVYYLEFGGQVLSGGPNAVADLREYPPEYSVQDLSLEVGEDGAVVEGTMHFSVRGEARREVLLSIINVTAVIVVLMLSTTNISRVIREEVVNPIMSLMETVEAFAANPLKPLKEVVNQKFKETIVVQNSVVRIGSLLRLALGEAGSRIMSRNLRSGQMRLDRPGDFVHAFFGFCDIRNFTDLTEVLRPEVVQVVNKFASYVHTAVSQNYGAPNKNIGDAFLLVWKPKAGISASQMADSALRSYVRIILEISRSKELEMWAQREDVQQRLPGFKMAMGFGIHYGWAIECAVGSEEKIDATSRPNPPQFQAFALDRYLSPHVNMASRLEAATKQYGTQILISGDTYALFSQDIQMLCRLVDRVTVKGSSVPIEIYTYDVPKALDEDVDFSSEVSPTDFLCDVARPAISEDFRAAHYLAMQNYLGGPGGAFANWKAAMDHFVLCVSMQDDGPSRTIMQYMSNNSDEGSAPHDWRGFRSLDEK